MKDLADITLKFPVLEDVMYDVLIEFLTDKKINYEIIDVENQRIEGDGEPDIYDEWVDYCLVNGIDIHDR